MNKENLPGKYIDPVILGEKTLSLLHVTDPSAIHILHTWNQGGAETYVTDFLLYSEDDRPVHLIAKACIKMCAKATMGEWFERRKLLAENGINFPDVHAVDYESATWVEEFIPYTFKEAYKQANNFDKLELQDQYIQAYLRIEGAGFRAVGGLHDIRSRGRDIVMIDVGEDIGGKKDIVSCDMATKDCAKISLYQMINR